MDQSLNLVRWVSRMQPYRFKIKHIPGSSNIADSLLRLIGVCQATSQYEEEAEEFVRFVAVSAMPNAMTTWEVEEASAGDEELAELESVLMDAPETRWFINSIFHVVMSCV